MENDVDFLAFVPDFMDDFEDLPDLADEVLDIEAMVVLIVELDIPCSGSTSAVSIALGWLITGSTGVAGISLTWGCGPGEGLIVIREVGRGEDSLKSGPALLGILSPLPHALS